MLGEGVGNFFNGTGFGFCIFLISMIDGFNLISGIFFSFLETSIKAFVNEFRMSSFLLEYGSFFSSFKTSSISMFCFYRRLSYRK